MKKAVTWISLKMLNSFVKFRFSILNWKFHQLRQIVFVKIVHGFSC